ncbi:uncharacterized protein LOC131226925 [Magnolia sinica]|uniref:uncharacterized protein LOC131226925 n=1 Tax=Magnolia sinica TaxID=86752 RepID=UPI002659ECAB|nr:uncharacterized protein LOC131226925 [Magnolia sinica]
MPQQSRQGPPAQQRAPQARVYIVATMEAKQDPLQTSHGTGHVNGTPVLTLFDSGTTLSFIDSSITSRLALNTTKMHVPLVVASPMGKFVETDKAYRSCPITLVNHEGRGKSREFESLQALEEAEPVEVTIRRIPVVRDFSEVFQEILGLPPRRAIEFCIDLKPGTAPISLPLFRMPPYKMEELRS